MLPTLKPSLARPSTRRKFWAQCGASRRRLELEQEAALQKALVEMIRAGLIESAHDCSDGGLAVALAEAGFANGIGVKVDLAPTGCPRSSCCLGKMPAGW